MLDAVVSAPRILPSGKGRFNEVEDGRAVAPGVRDNRDRFLGRFPPK
jgi:hypothetical protein